MQKTQLKTIALQLLIPLGGLGTGPSNAQSIQTTDDCSPVIQNAQNVTINCTISDSGAKKETRHTGKLVEFRRAAIDGEPDYCVNSDSDLEQPSGYCSIYFFHTVFRDGPDAFDSFLSHYGQSSGENWDFVYLTGRYTGEMKDGMPHGRGSFVVSDTSGTINLFDRTLNDGLFIGGSTFFIDGVWKDGALDGSGRVQMPNGGVLSCDDFLFNVCQKGVGAGIPTHTFGLRYRWGPGFGGGPTYTGPILGGRLNGKGRTISKTTHDLVEHTITEVGEFFEDKLFNGTQTHYNTFETIWKYDVRDGQIVDN